MRQTPKKILIYRLGSLGDTLLALPIFHAIRSKYASSTIIALSNIPVQGNAPHMMAVLENTGLVDRAIDYKIGMRDIRSLKCLHREIADEQIDLAINLTAPRSLFKSIRDYIFLRSCNINRVVGTPFRYRDLNCVVSLDTRLYEWEPLRLSRRISSLCVPDLKTESSWDLRINKGEYMEADKLLTDHGVAGRFIAFSVGTKADTKDWTNENWISMIGQLSLQHSRCTLVGIGAESDFARTEACLVHWKGKHANLCGMGGVRVIGAIVKRAELFVGHDSGPMHLAAVMGVPCVAVFSAQGLPGQWYPRGDKNVIFYRKTECFGCGLTTCNEFKKKCILDIRPAEVAIAISDVLNGDRLEKR